MRKLLCLFMLAALAACQEVKWEHSATEREEARVVEVSYKPSYTTLTMSCGFGWDGEYSCGPGITTVDAEYRVALKSERCDITFRTADRYREFQNVRGQSVDLLFKETYRVTYEKEGEARREIGRVRTGCEYQGFELR